MRIWILLTSMLVVQAGDAEFQPVANVTELMTALIVPASNVVGNVGLEGEPDDAAWAEIERQAILLAESGNLLLMPSRAQGRLKPGADGRQSQDPARAIRSPEYLGWSMAT